MRLNLTNLDNLFQRQDNQGFDPFPCGLTSSSPISTQLILLVRKSLYHKCGLCHPLFTSTNIAIPILISIRIFYNLLQKCIPITPRY